LVNRRYGLYNLAWVPLRSTTYYIEVLGKALDVLDAFVQGPDSRHTLQEISQLTKLNKNTVFRILYTLAEHGYVTKENQAYELGPKVLDLGGAKLRRTDLVPTAEPYLDRLRETFGETVNLGVMEEGGIRYVAVRESHERFRLAERVGGRDHLHCTALGKAHLAFMPFEEVRQLLRQHGMPRLTAKTITSVTALRKDLDATRQRGYSIDDEESMLGAFCVGAPILNAAGRPVAAISISGPTVRFHQQHVAASGAALIGSAGEIRKKLGLLSPA
jgi:DNA-binding IclR family transcriptional regulator